MTKENIIEILQDWNYWNRDLPKTFKREYYDKKIVTLSNAKEILILKGIRRSGKSTLLINYIKHLLENGVSKEEILFINLEDPRFINSLNLELLDKIKEAYKYYINPNKKPYIFLDEIQNIDNFEKWLLREYELKSSYLFVTGSNSKLLSSEISTNLSGRYLDILVMPLSFKEFLEFKAININTPFELISQKPKVQKFFEEYINFGGFPKVALLNDIELKKAELKSYFDSILLRDIVARYNLDNFRALQELAVFLLSSISNLISVNKIKSHLNLSYDLTNRYIEYLQNAFIVDSVPLFDYSYKKQLVNLKKVYSIDTGLSKRVAFEFSKKEGDYLENIVYLELKRRYSQIYYYKTKQGYEIDFLIKDEQKISHLVQVSLNLDDKKTLKREVRALINASNELQDKDIELIIITKDSSSKIVEDGIKIKVINILEWLLF